MQTLQVTRENAIKAFKGATNSGKEMLSNLFGKQVFTQDIADLINSFEDACELEDVNPNEPRFLHGDPDVIAYQKLKVIIKAANGDWVADFDNINQAKWSPWFYMNSPGFRFNVSYYVNASSRVGSRLCFKDEKTCKAVATKFIDLYEALFTTK